MDMQKQMPIAPDALQSLDDAPEAARLGQRQLFLNRYYRPVAMMPFILLLIVDFKFFPNANNWYVAGAGLATGLWAMGIAGYAFYLNFWFRCPKCSERFGLGEECKSCGLPRHAKTTSSDGTPIFETTE